MRNFEKCENKAYIFSSCSTCEARCCNGFYETVYAQIILEDFSLVAQKFPIAFIFGELGFLKPVVLLTNGKEFCRYVIDNKCSIYEKRPSVCRVYPLSAHITNEVYIDTNCPAVDNQNGKEIVKNGIIDKDFKDKILEDYQEKYINTHLHFERFNKPEYLKKIITIRDTNFYKFEQCFEDKFLKLHLKSLKFFDEYFK